MIKAVIFDFGRVISSQKPPSLFRTYEKDLGLAPHTLNPLMFDSPEWQKACLGRMSEREYWQAVGPRLGIHGAERIEAFRLRYRADESANPGVVDLIGRLKGRYRLAVLSNNPPGLVRWLADWDILAAFDVVFCSGDEGLAKPDPRAFQAVVDRLGVEPGEAVFVDDTAGHVREARRLGMKAVVFTTAERLEGSLTRILGRTQGAADQTQP